MRDYYDMTDEERERLIDDHYSKLKATLFSYIKELDDEEKDSTITYDLINSWEKGELVFILMGLAKREGIAIL